MRSDLLVAAGPAEAEALDAMVAAFHAEFGLDTPAATRRAALDGLLADPARGRLFWIDREARTGYAAITFGWSLELGGLIAFLDELFVSPEHRGKGLGRRALADLPAALSPDAPAALLLEVDRADTRLQAAYARAGFVPRDRYLLMSWPLDG